MQSISAIDGKLPVFVFPSSLTFYADDQSSHKQILTLYNPYEFAVKFRVFCTAPRKYSVVDPEGIIKPRCCIDIVIRHNAINPSNHGASDKFRIQMQEHGHKQVFGKKEITVTLLPTKPETSSATFPDMEQFEQLYSEPSPTIHSRQYALSSPRGRTSSGPSMIVITIAVICILALMLPTEGEPLGCLPPYLYLSMHQKLIAAYTLGLITMVIFRT